MSLLPRPRWIQTVRDIPATMVAPPPSLYTSFKHSRCLGHGIEYTAAVSTHGLTSFYQVRACFSCGAVERFPTTAQPAEACAVRCALPTS